MVGGGGLEEGWMGLEGWGWVGRMGGMGRDGEGSISKIRLVFELTL